MPGFECVSSLKNSHIIAQKQGAVLGNVTQVFLDQEQRRISALVYKEGGLFRDSSFVAMQDVAGIGRDVVFIPDETQTKHISDTAKPIGREIDALFGRWVTTTDGKHLGHLSDVDFDPATWDIAALRLAEGARLPVNKNEVVFGADEVMVDAELAGKLIATPQKQGLFTKLFRGEAISHLGDTLQKTLLGRRKPHQKPAATKKPVGDA